MFRWRADGATGLRKKIPLPLAALIGAVVGVDSCSRGFLYVQWHSSAFGAYRGIAMFAPFLLGAAVATAVTWLLTWIAWNPRSVGAIPDSPPVVRTGTTAQRGRATGALYVFWWIAGIAAAGGAVIGASATSDTSDMTYVWVGGIIGLLLGVALAVPAALMLWFLRRDRAS